VDYVLEPVPGTHSVALDRPGFGLSAPEGAVTSLAAQAAAVVALFPQGGERVILVGHSLGGAVVARVAAEHPQRVLALVLLASSLDPAQEVIHPLQPVGQMWPVKWMLPRLLRNANDELMAFKAELDLLQPMLARIQAPTLIVHGTQDDLVPFANVAYMQAQLTHAKCVKTRVLDGVNHFLPWNSEAAVREAIAWAVRPECGAP
jgi:pimeloyl-ACP methyl ester carboxylesterase